MDRRKAEYFGVLSSVSNYAYQVYCMNCDRPFRMDRRHSGSWICPRCSATGRKRRQRQRKRIRQAAEITDRRNKIGPTW